MDVQARLPPWIVTAVISPCRCLGFLDRQFGDRRRCARLAHQHAVLQQRNHGLGGIDDAAMRRRNHQRIEPAQQLVDIGEGRAGVGVARPAQRALVEELDQPDVRRRVLAGHEIAMAGLVIVQIGEAVGHEQHAADRFERPQRREIAPDRRHEHHLAVAEIDLVADLDLADAVREIRPVQRIFRNVADADRVRIFLHPVRREPAVRKLGVGREDVVERAVAEEVLDVLLRGLPMAGMAGVDQHGLFAAAHDVSGEVSVRQLALILDAEAAAGPQQVRRDDPRQFARRLVALPLGHASSPRHRDAWRAVISLVIVVRQIGRGA